MNRKPLNIIVVILALTFGWSCQKTDDIRGSQTTVKDSTDGPLDYLSEAECQELADVFYSNLSTIIMATSADESLKHSTTPLAAKMAALSVVTADGKTKSFLELSDDEQAAFMDYYTAEQSKELAQKLALLPSLGDYVARQNELVAEALADAGIDQESPAGQKAAGQGTKAPARISDPEAFLNRLADTIDALTFDSDYDYSATEAGLEPQATTQTKSLEYTHDEYELPYDYVRGLLVGQVKRGDIIIALPTYKYERFPMCSARTRFRFGHSEIFIKDIDETTSLLEDVSIGARSHEGVTRQTLLNWCWRSYVLEVCDIKRVQNADGTFHTEKVRVENPEALAECVEKYEGRPYVPGYGFMIAQNFAPDSFNCMSVIWWCLKETYGIDTSP